MDDIKMITAAVSAEMAERLDAAVESGEYPTTGEVVREALCKWADEQDRRQAALTRLRELIAEGEASESLPAEEVFADLRQYVAELVREDTKDAA